MKRHVQEPGVRKWSGDDLLELQGEGLKIADGFFSQWGDCVVCGCTVSGGRIAAGLVSIGGMVMPLAETEAEVFPVYLVAAEEHLQREYADDLVRDIAVRHYAKVQQEPPAEGTPCVVLSDTSAADTFLDLVQAKWLAAVQTRLTDLGKTDEEINAALTALGKTDGEADKRIAALEKKMPSYLDHTPTVEDDGYAIGSEVWTVDAAGDKTFWRCHDNASGAAVWKRSGEGDGTSLGSYGGAIYLTGQTDFSKPSILIKEGTLS